MEKKQILTITDALVKYFRTTSGVDPKGQSIVEVISNAADDYDFGTLALTVTPATDADDTFDKQASDLQENIHIGDSAITGKLKYVTGYQAYSGDEQNGNFLALKAFANKDNCLIKAELVGGIHGQVNLESDGLIVLRVTSTSQSVRFTVIKDGKSKVYDFALTSIVLAEPAPATATLTYAAGSYADVGSEFPDPVTAEVGTTVSIAFSPAPTREGYNFIGWKIGSEDAASPDFSEGGTETYTLSANVTLYPVFEAVSPQPTTTTLTLDLSGIPSGTTAQVQEYFSMMGMWGPVGMPAQGGGATVDVSVTTGKTYRVKVEGTGYDSAHFTGTYRGYEYSKETLTGNTHSSDSATVLSNPSDYTSTEWEFTSGDVGTIDLSTK